jgi:glycosyltransferase involved in cell wall biosynthesis
MKFVWVTRQTPLIPTGGAYAYSNGLLRGLLSTGATGTMVSYERPGRPPGAAEGLNVSVKPEPRRLRALSLLSHLPSDAYRLRSAEYEQRLAAAVTPDVAAVMVDFYAMGWVLPGLRRLRAERGGPGPALVYVSHQYEQSLRTDIARDFVGAPAMRAALWLDAWKAGALERRLIADCDIITAIAERDRERFMRGAPGKPVITLTPGYDRPAKSPKPITAKTPRKVVLSGALDWIAKRRNFLRFLDAAEAPFQAAGIELLVVGRTEPDFIRAVMARSRICRFTGEVPDIRPYMSQGRIGVMPDEVGGGFKLKLLDYAFGGLPIATIGSQAGDLPIDMSRDAIVRDTVGDLVEAIVAAIDDVPRLAAMSRRVLEACDGHFDWNERGRRLAAAVEAATR